MMSRLRHLLPFAAAAASWLLLVLLPGMISCQEGQQQLPSHLVVPENNDDVPGSESDDDSDVVLSRRHRSNYYLVGTGIYDMTGPAAQINLMGYAKAGQTAHGIHQRLRARAFIVSVPKKKQEEEETRNNSTSTDNDETLLAAAGAPIGSAAARRRDETTAGLRRPSLEEALVPPGEPPSSSDGNSTEELPDPDRTICFVSIDAGMGSDLLNTRVLKRLEDLLPPLAELAQGRKQQQKGGNGDAEKGQRRLCHLENLSISGTHTHSAPAGFIQYALYQVTSFGFSEEVMDAYVEGVAQAVRRAYENLQPGSVRAAEGLLWGANINRSPTSYLLNPEEEREEFAAEGDTDKRMVQLKFTAAADGKPLGLLNWFAVHGTSMNSSNTLISGDNKGYASYLAERHFNGNDTFPGRGDFVAAFASTNLGDVSPNTAGPRCVDTGLPCDLKTSTCGDDGTAGMCRSSGPGADMFESTAIIGERQHRLALQLFEESNDTVVEGDVSFRHSFVDMSSLNVTLSDSSNNSSSVVRTCPAALGYSFAGGTTDGPGDFAFTQGRNTSNPFWNMIGGFLSIPTQEEIECQFPKPILLNTGRANLPYDWDPNTVPISIFQVGQFFILNVPAEFTTMAGRRLRKAVREVLVDGGVQDPIITIAGLANSYTHYVTTFEEYAGQRYEAASTLYGPHTLSAYIQEFKRLTSDLVAGRASDTGPRPRDLTKYQLSLIPPAGLDTIGLGLQFGSVAIAANDSYIRGQDTAFVSFRSANPRNNPRTEGTFLTVDMLADNDTWVTRYVDGDWCTKFYWQGGLSRWGSSFADIYWKIPAEQPRGLYRICHYGTRSTFLGYVESLLYHSGGLTSNWFGSYAVSLAFQAVELAINLSEKLQSLLSKAGPSRLKDFQGCSNAFLVHGKPHNQSNPD